jgi:hypothetical protein
MRPEPDSAASDQGTPDQGAPAVPATLQQRLDAVFGGAVDPRDAAAELRWTIRRSTLTPADQEELFARLAVAVHDAIATGDSGGVDTLLAMLDAAADEVGTDAALFVAAFERGRYEHSAGRPERTLAELARAEALARTPVERMRVAYNAGLSWLLLGNTVEAETRLGVALRLATELDDLDTVVLSTNLLADLAARRNEPKEAERILATARARVEAAGRADLAPYLAMSYGVMSARSGDLVAAQEEYRQLADLAADARTGMDPEVRARAEAAATSGRITLHRRQGDLSAALELVPRLRELLERCTPGEQCNDLVLLSQLEWYRDRDQSLQDARRAVALARQHDLGFEQSHALAQLALVLGLAGSIEPAYHSGVAALELAERLRVTAGDVTSRLAFVADKSGMYETVVQLCLALADLRRDPAYRTEALAWVERGKSRTLGELLGLGSLQAPAGLTEELVAAERELLRWIRVYEASGARSRAAYADAWRDLDALWNRMAATAPEYVATRRGHTVQLEQIRRLLAGAHGGAPPASGSASAPPGSEPEPMPEPMPEPAGGPGYQQPRDVVLRLPDGGEVPLTIVVEKEALSRRQLLAALADAGSTGDWLVLATRNLAVLDDVWWSLFDQAGAGGDWDELGRRLSDLVRAWGEPRQVQAAGRWRSGRSVRRLAAALAAAQQGPAAAALAALARDRPAREACAALRDEVDGLVAQPVRDVLAAEVDWLDVAFFGRLARLVRDLAATGDAGSAAAGYLTGVAAATMLVDRPAAQWTAAAAFVDEFPEYRFAADLG